MTGRWGSGNKTHRLEEGKKRRLLLANDGVVTGHLEKPRGAASSQHGDEDMRLRLVARHGLAADQIEQIARLRPDLGLLSHARQIGFRNWRQPHLLAPDVHD